MMFGMPFSVASFSPVAKLGYQVLQEAYKSYASIEDVNDNTKVEDVSLIVVDPQIVQQYVNFFDDKIGEIREGLKGSVNKIESHDLQCRMQFGSENSKEAHKFLAESWGLRETSKKIWGYLSGKRLFLTDGIAPYKLAVASKSGRIDNGSNFFELDDVKRDLIMVFADLVTFLQVHTASSLDPKKLSDAQTDADISTMVNKSGTVYTFVSLDIVLLFIITNHLYNILNMTHYLYQNGNLVYPTLYAHIDHLNEYITSIAIPLLEQKQEQNLQERSESFRNATSHLVSVLKESQNIHMQKMSTMLSSIGDKQVNEVSYMNAAPTSGIASFLAKKSYSNIASSMGNVKAFVTDVAEQKGHYDQMQKVIAQNKAAIEASKQMIKEKPNDKTLKVFGGNFGHTMLGGADLGGKFKKAIPPFEVARLSQSYFQSVLYKVETSAPTAMLKHIHESMPLMNYYFDLVRSILRLMFSYNDISLNSSMLNTFIGSLYLKMFTYYDAFFTEVKDKTAVDEKLNGLMGKDYVNTAVSITLEKVAELDPVKHKIVAISYSDINLTTEKEIAQLLFGSTQQKMPEMAYLECIEIESLELRLDVLFSKMKDPEQIPIVQAWVDKVLMIKAIAAKQNTPLTQAAIEIPEDADAKGFGDDVAALLKREKREEVYKHFAENADDLEKVIASCFPLEMPMLQFLFRKRSAVSQSSLAISGVTPFYLLLDYSYSMVVHSFVVHYARESMDKANQAIKKHLCVSEKEPKDKKIEQRLEKLIQEYLKRYQKCFSQEEFDELVGNPINKVVEAIAASAKDALLPTMSLILATMMSLFERLVLLDIGKRSASSMIKQYGSMIFHNEAFRGSLKKLYEDERSIAQVLEAITYQLLPELEQYADTVNSHYWLSGLKKVYNSVRPQMMTLSDSLYKHGQMAVDYLDKASVYLKDGQKVDIKQKAYLTLLSNIHEFLKQQVQTVPYNAKGEKFEYDTFVQSAIIKNDQIQASVKEQKLALLKKVSDYSELKQYPLETKMFFYSMLRGGGWSLFSTHPIPSDEFLLSSVDSQLLLLSLLKDTDQIVVDATPPRLPAPVPLFRDLQEQIVTSYQHNNTLDWCFLDLAHQGRRNGQYKLGVINQLVVLLQFLPEDKNPLRVSLLTQINLVQQLMLSLKSYEVAEKRKAVAAMLMSCLYFKRDYDLVQPFKEAVLAADDSGSALDLMLDSFAHSCRYDLSSMPGTMYFILFSLDQFMSLESSTLRKLFKLKVQSCGFLNQGRKDFLNSFIESEMATNIPLLKNQIDLTVSAIQCDIHKAFIRIKAILSQDKDEMEAIKNNITKVSKASIKNIKDRVYTSDLYQKSRQVFWILKSLGAAGIESKTGKFKNTRVASFFEFVKKEPNQVPVSFVSANNFMWSEDAFDEEEYVPINRIKASHICDKTILKDDYLSPISDALAQLAYPAVYALIRREVNKLLNLVDYQKGTKKLKLPEENCSTALAVFLVMMSYIAKVSYVFNARGEADAGRIITTIDRLNLYEFESFFMIYTEYDELYRDLYNSKAQAVSDGNMVQPFDDLNSFTTDRDQHFQLLKRLIDEQSFKAQKSQKIDQLYCRNDSYTVSQKQSDGAVVMDVDSKWWVEWKNVDLYDEQALIRLYDDSDWMSKQSTDLRIKKLKAYVTDFEAALKR
ncbi:MULTISPECIES: hypothetical protein [Cysteiniphilum]|uniref:Uncharacterized protein n=1 Tax=Cysteiniphilum litorale TaxID=2056700 RepID=A0A8J2Z6C2_9GAMM|nr:MULTISPECIES: hypothetical protein [Cysteiniphilum]GGG04526.1 hypothetical protein GCM10010995_22520 [Cysteiniphilum litorale]